MVIPQPRARAAKVFLYTQLSSWTSKKAAACCLNRRLTFTHGLTLSLRPDSALEFIVRAFQRRKARARSSPPKIFVPMLREERSRSGSRMMFVRRRRAAHFLVHLVLLRAELILPISGNLRNLPNALISRRPAITTTRTKIVTRQELIRPAISMWM